MDSSNQLEMLEQSFNDYKMLRKCNKIEHFDHIRKIIKDISNERQKLYIVSLIFDTFDITDKDRLIVYAFFIKCDKIYGKTAKFADLSEQDQEIVLSFSF